MYKELSNNPLSARLARMTSAWLVFALAVAIGFASYVDAQQPRLIKGVSSNATQGFAVVELFTSQGCSSCPSADENLSEITKQASQKGDNIVTLSFHVDYWNNLGWRDPYSMAEATKRQRLYAGVHGSKQVYTPQMVVNGTTELLGSSRDKSKVAIAKAIKQRPRSKMELMTNIEGNTVKAEWKIDGLQPDDIVNLALVQDQVEDRVMSGENSGRTLKHLNVVRDFKVISPAKEADSLSLTIPEGVEPQSFHVVVYVQSPVDAGIHAVARREVLNQK